MNLATALELAAHRYPSAAALITRSASLSYAQWNRRVNSVAWALLQAGLQPGERIAICTANIEAAATTYFAAHKAGAACVLLNSRWKEQELLPAMEEAGVKAILYDQTTKTRVTAALRLSDRALMPIEAGAVHSEGIEAENGLIFEEIAAARPTKEAPPVPRDDSAVGTVLYTSGTTGRPKGVARSCRSDYYAAMALILEHRWERFERVLLVMPLFHTMGLHTLISMVLLNGTAVLLPRVDPEECLHRIAAGRITALYLVPTIFHDLVTAGAAAGLEPLPVPKLAFAGAPMSARLMAGCRELFQPEVFVNQYGCTEMLAITINPRPDLCPHSVGRPALHSRIRIVSTAQEGRSEAAEGETGEILVDASLPQSFSGYLNNPAATGRAVREGWYYTGDLGYFDDRGELCLAGRVDDMIISGGENIYPGEVERILLEHPQVKEAAVIGIRTRVSARRWPLLSSPAPKPNARRAGAALPGEPAAGPLQAATLLLFHPHIPKTQRGKCFTSFTRGSKATGKPLPCFFNYLNGAEKNVYRSLCPL